MLEKDIDLSTFSITELYSRKDELNSILEEKKSNFVFSPDILSLMEEKILIEQEIKKRDK